MKKIGALSFAVVLCLLCSCTREFVCQCTYTYEGKTPGLPDPVTEEFIIKDTKKGAISNCQRHSESATTNGITFTKACSLY